MYKYSIFKIIIYIYRQYLHIKRRINYKNASAILLNITKQIIFFIKSKLKIRVGNSFV